MCHCHYLEKRIQKALYFHTNKLPDGSKSLYVSSGEVHVSGLKREEISSSRFQGEQLMWNTGQRSHVILISNPFMTEAHSLSFYPLGAQRTLDMFGEHLCLWETLLVANEVAKDLYVAEISKSYVGRVRSQVSVSPSPANYFFKRTSLLGMCFCRDPLKL